MSVLDIIRKTPMPACVRHMLRVMYRIPEYSRQELADQEMLAGNAPFAAIHLGENRHVIPPSSRLAVYFFRKASFSSEGYKELKEFLSIADGASTFADVGASVGYFSAVFVATRTQDHTIISVEMDPESIKLLDETRKLNAKENTKWIIDPRGVSDTRGTIGISSSGYGGEVTTDVSCVRSRVFSELNGLNYTIHDVEFAPLSDIFTQSGVDPDLIKLDIEGFELEAVLGSKAYLAEKKPRIWMEFHFDQMRERGADPARLTSALDDMGYREWRSGRSMRETFGGQPIGRHHLGLR